MEEQIEGRKIMEGTVSMSLNDYDALQNQIKKLVKMAADADARLTDLKIFKLEISYDGSLTVRFEPDAKKYLDKAFAKYASEYDIKKTLKDECIWDYATKKATNKSVPPEIVTEATPEIIF